MPSYEALSPEDRRFFEEQDRYQKMRPGEKPRASAKLFPEMTKKKAEATAKAANKIVDVLWSMSPKQRKEALERAVKDLAR